ncbi:putative inhibitor of apoptosis [Mytilus galloprovincialis]|uniref:putative inhibitor of apoptosis n=1 Tax=Mytilus galloprovincialis TaxID=29158 RepID=UPI003F7B594B
MAMGGFMYAGYSDYARCFFCGGGLRNWEPGDDPWVEHARWFPKCIFLIQNKGENFIDAVQKKHKKELDDQEPNATNTPETKPRNETPSLNNSIIQRNIIHGQLQTVAARSVIEMGYTNQQVIDAFQQLSTSDKDMNSISAVDIMYILLEDDAHPQQKDTETLLEENRHLKDLRRCKVCLDREASIAFLPCGHIACCAECAPAMRRCPLCRTFVKGTVKTYLA